MPFQQSTDQEIADCQALVDRIVWDVKQRVADGTRVHFVFDFDHVLVAGRSDDSFELLGCDVARYQQYEGRLIFEPLEDGPWAALASRCGELHFSQDIVTARQATSAMRAHFWLLDHRLPNQREHFLGSQSKSGSYRDILSQLKNDVRAHIYVVDDGEKHVEAFRKTAAELGMSENTTCVLSPKIRTYTEAELKREVEMVMGYAGKCPGSLTVRPSDRRPARHIHVAPNPRESVRAMVRNFTCDILCQDLVNIAQMDRGPAQPEVVGQAPSWFEHLDEIVQLIHKAKTTSVDMLDVTSAVRDCPSLERIRRRLQTIVSTR